jgi:hypothetical protein
VLSQHAGDDETRDGQSENQRYRGELPRPQTTNLGGLILVLRNRPGKRRFG